MKEIADKKFIDECIKRNHITSHLKDKGIEFRAFRYECGEIISNMMEVVTFIQFIINGSIDIYYIRYDGTKSSVRHIDTFTVLGDVELYGNKEADFFVEASSEVLCLALPLEKYREKLINDNEFLRFLLKSLSRKFIFFAQSQYRFATLEEKFLYYIKEECEDNMITSVEDTVFQMRCSRRQLQRVLKKLTDEKIIIKTGKGCYRLNY